MNEGTLTERQPYESPYAEAFLIHRELSLLRRFSYMGHTYDWEDGALLESNAIDELEPEDWLNGDFLDNLK